MIIPKLLLNHAAMDWPTNWPSPGELNDWLGQHWLAALDWLGAAWIFACAWLSQPHILAVLIAFALTFTFICVMVPFLGFGPGGVVAGTLAAAFQSWAYGAFTPAGSIFATLTSMAMLGLLMPVVAIVAAILATVVALIVLACGVGT